MTHSELLFTTGPVVYSEGRYFITFGNAGFNSPANNRFGYASAARAEAAIRFYSNRGAAKRTDYLACGDCRRAGREIGSPYCWSTVCIAYRAAKKETP